MAETIKYRMFHLLGSGGMAEVHLGALVGATGIHRRVAIKRLTWPSSGDAEAVERFSTEAQILSRMNHPNIVSIIDYQTDEAGAPFLVMDYVEGCTLAKLLSKGACPPSTAIYIAMEMLRALAYAHGMPIEAGMRGLVHRDISPQNVLLSWEGTVVVSDFGVAKVMETIGARSVSFRGKMAYASPEQAKKQTLDGRSDLFSVGVVLWEMLAGRSLFQDATWRTTFSNVLSRPIPSLGEAWPISAELQAVVTRLLERDPDRRYPTAEDAMRDLLECPDWPRSGRDELAHLLAARFERVRRSLVTVEDPFCRGPVAGGNTQSTASVELDLAPRPWPDGMLVSNGEGMALVARAFGELPAEPSVEAVRDGTNAVPRRSSYLVATIALAIVVVGPFLLTDRPAPSHTAGSPSVLSVVPTIASPSERALPSADSPVPTGPREDSLEASKNATPGRLDEPPTTKARESARVASSRRPSSGGREAPPAAPSAVEADAAQGKSSAESPGESSVYPKSIRAKLSTGTK